MISGERRDERSRVASVVVIIRQLIRQAWTLSLADPPVAV
jgi:hypothetical protein